MKLLKARYKYKYLRKADDKMNIDWRYIEFLAETAPSDLIKKNKWLPRLAYFAFFMVVIGLLLFMGGRFYGLGIAGAGCILSGVAILLKRRESNDSRDAFIKYYDENDKLPPWPEKPGKVTKNERTY